MALQRVDEMRDPPVVGEFYMVPTIFYRFGNDSRRYGTTLPPKQRHYPIMGTRHEDTEHIGFPYFHYHMDWRFALETTFRVAVERRPDIGDQAIFGMPLFRSCEEDHGPITYRRMKCRRIAPINTVFASDYSGRSPSNTQRLHRAWFGKPAVPGPHGWICPHRGTVLGSIPVEEDGTITCPLHGLKFCAKTGESVATHDMTAK